MKIVHITFACNLLIIILNKSFYYNSHIHQNQTGIFPFQ